MNQRLRRPSARGLAALATPLLALGVVAGTAPAPAVAATSPRYVQQAELTVPGAAGFDQVGYTVALSAAGTTALVGAPGHDGSRGAVYVYTLRHRTWSRTAELTDPHGAPEDMFGTSVALSAAGTTALIGTPGRNTAYVFSLRHRAWTQTATLAGEAGDDLGYAVALSAAGTTALAGAPERNDEAGAAYVFTLRHHGWSQTAELTAADAAGGDGLGQSVALSASGTTALAGAPNREDTAGAAYVFAQHRGAWAQTGELTGAARDGFGLSVALSAAGTTAVAGAPFHNDLAGAAYVFALRHRAWSRTALLTAPHPSADFGQSVALSGSGTTALAGASETSPAPIGAADAFSLRHRTWSPVAELTASDATAADGFGQALALSFAGTTALIGAPLRDNETGAAYVFRSRP